MTSIVYVNNNENPTPKYGQSVKQNSARHLQTLSSTPQRGFLSNSELKSAVDEYCQDPNGWVNNTKYVTYG